MPVRHPDITLVVRLEGDNQLIGIQALGIDEGTKARDEIIHNQFILRMRCRGASASAGCRRRLLKAVAG